MARAGPAGDAALRRREQARRRADQQRRHRRAGLRRRPGQRPRGRHVAGRHRHAGTSSSRRASTPGASGTSASGTLLAAAPAQGLRVRQAALHRLPALRRAAPAVPRVPRDVPAGGRRTCGSATRWRSRPGRPAARPGLRAGHPRRARPSELRRAVRRGARAAAGIPLLPRRRSATAGSSTGRTRRAYVAAGLPCWSRPRNWSLHHAEPFGPLDSRRAASTPRPSCSPR